MGDIAMSVLGPVDETERKLPANRRETSGYTSAVQHTASDQHIPVLQPVLKDRRFRRITTQSSRQQDDLYLALD